MTRKGVGKHAHAWILAFFFEVLFHGTMCTVIQGIEVSFYLYPLMGMPVFGYLLFGYCDRRTLVRTSLFMAITTIVTGTLTLVFVDHVGSIYVLTGMHQLSQFDIILLRSINISFTTLMLMIFTLAFYMELTKLLKAVNESNKQLDYIATHDALTGLSNRHSLWQFFEGLEKSGDNYCIILGDLDDFKKINDTYGHECGDIVLKSVSGIILDKTKSDEMACRWGGEEMLIIMRGSREDCLKRVGEIKDLIYALDITQDNKHVKVSMTFGFVCCDEVLDKSGEDEACHSTERPPANLGIDNLISEVDKRLYVGKRSGKNVIVAV
ncbi:MAG: GGDEF domain-containing protein [Oscillospiraceae bacterium]